MNQINLIGRITKDLEIRTTESKKVVCNFSIAVNRNYTNEAGEREADFINVAIWGQQAENLKKYQGKGSLIAVSGSLRVESYEVEGQKRNKTYVLANNIEYLSNKSANETQEAPVEESKNDPFAEMGINVKNIEISDEELPF